MDLAVALLDSLVDLPKQAIHPYHAGLAPLDILVIFSKQTIRLYPTGLARRGTTHRRHRFCAGTSLVLRHTESDSGRHATE